VTYSIDLGNGTVIDAPANEWFPQFISGDWLYAQLRAAKTHTEEEQLLAAVDLNLVQPYVVLGCLQITHAEGPKPRDQNVPSTWQEFRGRAHARLLQVYSTGMVRKTSRDISIMIERALYAAATRG